MSQFFIFNNRKSPESTVSWAKTFCLINCQEKPLEKCFQSQTHLTEDGFTVRFTLMEMKSFVKVLLFSPQTTTAELLQTKTKKDKFYLTVKETSFQNSIAICNYNQASFRIPHHVLVLIKNGKSLQGNAMWIHNTYVNNTHTHTPPTLDSRLGSLNCFTSFLMDVTSVLTLTFIF